tara:strand:- start:270 stop:674 length:405 start_codon:yes stop_codon:yes gene_type:complete
MPNPDSRKAGAAKSGEAHSKNLKERRKMDSLNIEDKVDKTIVAVNKAELRLELIDKDIAENERRVARLRGNIESENAVWAELKRVREHCLHDLESALEEHGSVSYAGETLKRIIRRGDENRLRPEDVIDSPDPE